MIPAPFLKFLGALVGGGVGMVAGYLLGEIVSPAEGLDVLGWMLGGAVVGALLGLVTGAVLTDRAIRRRRGPS
jgi:membrane protein DedA with SNARE-associated domain